MSDSVTQSAPHTPDPQTGPNGTIADRVQRDLGVGTTWLVVLATIARAQSPLHGYEIARTLAQASPHGLGVKHGTLYPILRTLEGEGLLTSTLVPSTEGPARRCFTITPAGRNTLSAWAGSWRATRGWIDQLLGEVP